MATCLLAASELDVGNEAHWEMLRPILQFLDKAWLIPALASQQNVGGEQVEQNHCD